MPRVAVASAVAFCGPEPYTPSTVSCQGWTVSGPPTSLPLNCTRAGETVTVPVASISSSEPRSVYRCRDDRFQRRRVHEGELLHLQVEIETLQRQPSALGPASEIERAIPGLRVQLGQLQAIARTDQLHLDILVPYPGRRSVARHAIVEPQGPIRLGLLERTSQTEIKMQRASTLRHGRDERFEYLQINVGSLEL